MCGLDRGLDHGCADNIHWMWKYPTVCTVLHLCSLHPVKIVSWNFSYKGAFKYYISTFGGVGGLTRNAYFAYGVRGGGGS